MSRAKQQTEQLRRDSFLDFVANFVGVLVILITIFGARSTQNLASAPPSVAAIKGKSPAEIAELEQQLEKESRQAISSQQNVLELAAQVARLGDEADAHDRQRVTLAMHREVIEKDLEQRRSKLSEEERQQFDVQRQLLESKIKLDHLTQEHLALASSAATPETVECVPTPLAKEVDVPSIHLRLRKGLVSIVPVEKLNNEVNAHADRIISRLRSSDQVVETLGPVDGYRVRVRLEKRIVNVGAVGGGRQQIVLDQSTQYLPMSDDIGQNIQQALLPGSALYEYLEAHRRESPPVDVWLYQDSFGEFQSLKRALRERNYTIAIRPMPQNAKIGSSPYGSKSAAQ